MSSRKQSLLASLLMTICLLTIGCMAILVFIVPKFEAVFAEMEMERSSTIVATFKLSQWLGGRMWDDQFLPGVVYVLVVLTVVITGLIHWKIRLNRTLSQTSNHAVPTY